MKQQAILCLFTDWTCASSSGVFPSRHQPSHAYLSRISTFTPIQAYSISSIRMYISICGRPASFETENKCCRQSQFSSVQFSFSVVSNSLCLYELYHARPHCPSPAPRVYPNSCPLSRWCHPTISSSIIPLSSCPQSFPLSGCFQMSQLFASGGQNTGVLTSTLVLPMNTQDWSPVGWTGWISLQSKGRSRVFSKTTVQKHQFFSTQLFL